MADPFLMAFAQPDPRAKAARVLALNLDDALRQRPTEQWPDRPGRPAQPHLVPARQVPKRSPGTLEGRIALLHALAHIELNAIDLALDMIGRFADSPEIGSTRVAFVEDWISVARDEARHFLMLSDRLAMLGSAYGALTAHDGLWQTAMRTTHDILERLAIAPLTHEARGLDVTPAMIEKLRSVQDPDSAAILDVIYRDEIGHVAAGMRWFEIVCQVRGLPPGQTYRLALERIGLAKPHPPFNETARRHAGLSPDFDVFFGKTLDCPDC